MFNNHGFKLSIISYMLFVATAIIIVISTANSIVNDGFSILHIFSCTFRILAAYIIALAIGAFGDLVEDVHVIRLHLRSLSAYFSKNDGQT